MNLTYEQNSTPQKIVGTMLSDYLWSAIASHTEQKLVTIADFGASKGLNSCRQFKPLLQRFRDLSNASVLLYHTDTPENHWSVLFSNLTSSPYAYHSVPNVHSFAVGLLHATLSRQLPRYRICMCVFSLAVSALSKQRACLTIGLRLRV